MARDERRQAVKPELRFSDEEFRAAVELTLDALAIISPVRDSAGKVIDCRYEYVNDAYCSLVGWDREELLGHRFGELFPQYRASERFAIYQRVAETGEPCRTDAVHGERAWRGTRLASRTIDTIVAPIGDKLVLSARDVTEHRRSEQEVRLRGELLDLAHDAVIVRDPVESRVTFWNREAETIYGYNRAEAVGRVTHELLGTVFPESAQAVDEALAREVQWDGELRHTRKDGAVIVVSSRQALARDADGQPLAIIALNSDITERKQAEQELQLRAELLDLAHDAVIVREPVESRVTFWNREAETIYGYSRADAVGRVTHELLATVFPEAEEAVDEALAREGGWVGELRHTCKDGTVIVVSSRQALARDADGQPLAIIELNSDITEEKRSEAELAYMSGLLERTQQISKTGGWEYDLATGKLTWTDEVYRIYGSERRYGPVALERAISAFDPESAPIISAALERLVADGEPSDLEVGLIRADGQRIWVRVVGEAVFEGGRVVRVRGIIADVSDRRLAEEEIRTLNAELEQRVAARTADLERVNRELESFAYSVSHDLRAPLRAVNAFSQLLLDDYGDEVGEEGRHYLERVRAGAARMGDLIDAVLQLSRLSRRRLVRAPVDMSALASEIVAELQSGEPDRPVAVEIQDGLRAEADLALVRSVLGNLLANAYKFTSDTPHPRVRFAAVEENGVPVYFVADDGAGFDMAHAKELFRPFHRLHRDSEFPGEGIGLATVVRAVHRHGGMVWAHSAVNEGATFYFSLMPGAHPPADAATGEDVIPTWQPSDEQDGR